MKKLVSRLHISDSIDSRVRRDKVYKDRGEKLVLASLSDLYSELIKISIDISELSTSFISYHLLTTYSAALLTTILIKLYILISLRRESLS